MAIYTFTTLDDSSATAGTFAQGINDSGQVVGYYAANGTDFAFLDSNGSFTTYPNSQGVVSTTATAGASAPAQGLQPTPGTSAHGITQSATMAGGINNSGMIVGSGFFDDFGSGQTFDSAFDAFIGNAAGTSLKEVQAPINGVVINGRPSSVKTFGFGINNNGEIVGNYTDQAATDSPHAFIDNNGSFVEFNYQNDPTYAQGINDLNQVVGYFNGTDPNQPSVSTAHGFLYNNGALSYFDDPNAVNGTFAEGINNLDQIVGYYQDGNGFKHGFVFNQPTGSYTTVDVTGAINTIINGINNNGQLVGYYVDSSGKTHGFVATPPNPAPPSATTAVMIMTQPSSGSYEIYDIGNNSVLAAYSLTQASSPWQPVHVGGFDGGDTSDLLLRNSSTGAFELCDASGNAAAGPVSLGGVGTDWSVLGFGDFSGNPGETDMLMRQSGTAKLEVYDISNNQITGAASMGAVGPEWSFLGVGDFSSNANETDLLMRDSNNGALEVYNVSHNAIVSATGMGAIGVEWSFVGVGNFSGNAGETDMLMRNSNTGALEVYNVHNDQIVGAQATGAVGLEWSVVGIGDFSGNPGETDMITRNANTGAFEIYDISHDSIASASSIGAVGTDWQAAGIAAYQTGSAAIASSGDQLPDAAPNADPFIAGSFGGASAQDLPQIANFMQPSSGFWSAVPAAGTPIGGDLAAMLNGAPQQPHA